MRCGALLPDQAKAMAGADGKLSAGGEGGGGGDMAPPNYGAKYEQHVGTLQKQLEEAKQQCARALLDLLPLPCSLRGSSRAVSG